MVFSSYCCVKLLKPSIYWFYFQLKYNQSFAQIPTLSIGKYTHDFISLLAIITSIIIIISVALFASSKVVCKFRHYDQSFFMASCRRLVFTKSILNQMWVEFCLIDDKHREVLSVL